MLINKIYFSPTGGTKKVIDTVADVWNGEKRELDLSIPDYNYETTEIHQEDVCLIAIPVFEGRVPKTVIPRLKAIKGNGALAVLIAVYGARAIDDALLELKDICQGQGFQCRAAISAVAEHSILRIFGEHRPDENDCMELKKVSEKIQELFREGKLPECVSVPGKKPYIEMGGVPVRPSGNDACIQCGVCAQECPTEAISIENCRMTDEKKCIMCMRCVSICPTHARDFAPELVKVFQEKMRPAFAGERHNELFVS